jgi:hypothetical protein
VLDASAPETALAERIWQLVGSHHPGNAGGGTGWVAPRARNDSAAHDADRHDDAPDGERAGAGPEEFS